MTYELSPERRAKIKLSDNKIRRNLPAIAEIEIAIKERRDKSFKLEVANPSGLWREWQYIRTAFPEWHNGVVRMKVEGNYVQVYVNASLAVPIQDEKDHGFSRKPFASMKPGSVFVPAADTPVVMLGDQDAPIEEPQFFGETMTGEISLEAAKAEVEQWIEREVTIARIDMTAWEDALIAIRIQRAAFQRLVMEVGGWTETKQGDYFVYRRKS